MGFITRVRQLEEHYRIAPSIQVDVLVHRGVSCAHELSALPLSPHIPVHDAGQLTSVGLTPASVSVVVDELLHVVAVIVTSISRVSPLIVLHSHSSYLPAYVIYRVSQIIGLRGPLSIDEVKDGESISVIERADGVIDPLVSIIVDRDVPTGPLPRAPVVNPPARSYILSNDQQPPVAR